MKYLFYITYILYIFFKTLHITNNKKNVEIDVIYLLFYLIELVFKTEVYFIFSLLNITFMMYYNKRQIKRFTPVLYQTIITYIFIVIIFKPSILGTILLSIFDRNIIVFYRKIDRKINEIKYKKKICLDNLILIQTDYKEEVKSFLAFRPDVIVISNEQKIYKELSKKLDKFTKIIVANNNELNIKNVIYFDNNKINDLNINEIIKNIKYKDNKSIITYKVDGKRHTLTTNLISYDENVMALSLYFLGFYLKLNDSDIRRCLNNLKSKKITISKMDDGILISNIKCLNKENHYEGLKLINAYKGNKIIVTGGIKNADEKTNFEFSDNLVKNFKYIILLNTTWMPLIYEKLIEHNYDRNKIYIIENLEEYQKIISILKNKKTYILLDSDI